jgi:hypothetical protein
MRCRPSTRLQRKAQQTEGCLETPSACDGPSMRALLIKRWGAGFWSDVDHVVLQLAAAEILGREPVVDWGVSGPYGNGRDETFGLYFEPVSELRLGDIRHGTIWPETWGAANLGDDLPFAATGKIDEKYGNYYFASEKKRIPPEFTAIAAMQERGEDVLVSFVWEKPSAILKASRGTRFAGLTEAGLRRLIYSERIHLLPPIRRRIDEFWQQNLAGEHALAVHIRGSDKIVENPALNAQNEKARQVARKWPGKIFLLTDSEASRREWQDEFGDRLVTQDCLRTDSATLPNFLIAGSDGYRNGSEILIDTYIAARCDRFVGTYSSNVGKYVAVLGGRAQFLDRGLFARAQKLVRQIASRGIERA